MSYITPDQTNWLNNNWIKTQPNQQVGNIGDAFPEYNAKYMDPFRKSNINDYTAGLQQSTNIQYQEYQKQAEQQKMQYDQIFASRGIDIGSQYAQSEKKKIDSSLSDIAQALLRRDASSISDVIHTEAEASYKEANQNANKLFGMFAQGISLASNVGSFIGNLSNIIG